MEGRKPLEERKPLVKLEKRLKELELEATQYFRSPTEQNKKRSLDNYQVMLDEIYTAQKEEKRPIHKGLPYHNMGIIRFTEKKIEEALKLYLLAYIEDTLNFPVNYEDISNLYPAYYNLHNVFDFSRDILTEIKNIANKYKKTEKRIFNPEEIFEELKLPSSLVILTNNKKLVFIGGDYIINSENIAIVEEHVRDLGFIPIIAHYVFRNPDKPEELLLPKERTYEESLNLLGRCKHAIFSVVHGSGHFFEIAKCIDDDYEIDYPLLLVHTFRGEKDKSEKISWMVRSIGFGITEYTDPFDQLKNKIRDYLYRDRNI